MNNRGVCAMSEAGFVDSATLDQVKVGRDYVAAKYGFRNHWYPVLFSADLEEGKPKPVQVCGERILLNRIDGSAYAIKDQCLHKGVPLSRKAECYSKGTVTCWYHGFTYRFSDGELCAIMGMPQSNVIGRRRLKTYPCIDAKGLLFVFVGDETIDVPPLAEDVPPGFLDETLVVRGRRLEVASNWRLGCENGFDTTHIFIHKDSGLMAAADIALPLGLAPAGSGGVSTEEEDCAPKGVRNVFSPETCVPVFEGQIDGKTVLRGSPDGANQIPLEISIWLPGVLRVQPWPAPHITQFEWYVPIDGERHSYFHLLGASCATPAEEASFDHEYRERWLDAALIGFNDDDIWAREASQAFYADDRNWLSEQLFEADVNIVQWRRIAGMHHRGLQTPEHIR
jgi:carbazole 1,9a-dioxygenase terminal dioxygenase component